MTRTTSPGCDPLGEVVGGGLGRARGGGLPAACPCRGRIGQGLRAGDRAVGVAVGPDIGDHGPVGRGEDLGEGVQHGRRAMERQRLVDGPHPPARVALAHGRQRAADRRGMVAVVVEHRDAPRLALQLEAAAHAAEAGQAGGDLGGREIGGRGGGGRRERVVGVLAPGQLDQGRHVTTGQARDGEAIPFRSGGEDPPGHRPGRQVSGRLVVGPQQREGSQAVAKVGQSVGHLAAARIAHVDHDERQRRRRADPRGEHVDHRRPVGEDVRVVPLGVEDHGHGGVVRGEVVGVLVGLDDHPGPPPPARRRGGAAGQVDRQERADRTRMDHDPRRRAGGSPSRSWWTCRACR